MRAAVVFNPTKISQEALAKVVDPAAAAAGFEPALWLATTADDPGVGMAREAADKGATVVLAVGGDGTVRCVAEGLRGTQVRLALCPQGTGNLLARNLGLPLDNLTESVDAAFNGVPRQVDLGVLDITRSDFSTAQHVFVVMAGMGLDAQVMATTDEKLKKKVGTLAYVKAGAQALAKKQQMRLEYRFDDGAVGRAKVHTLLIGNCGSIGHNVFLMPDAAIDDGLLDVVAAVPKGLFGWLRLARKVLIDNALIKRTRSKLARRSAENTTDLGYRQCERVQLRLKHPELIQLDGDPMGEVVSARAWVERAALTLMMLPGWTSKAAEPKTT